MSGFTSSKVGMSFFDSSKVGLLDFLDFIGFYQKLVVCWEKLTQGGCWINGFSFACESEFADLNLEAFFDDFFLFLELCASKKVDDEAFVGLLIMELALDD